MRRLDLLLVLFLPAALAAQQAPGPIQQPQAPPQEDSLGEADRLAAEGRNGEAVALYRSWLAANPGAGSYGEVLLKAASAAPEATLALSLLAEFGPRIADEGQRAEVLARQLSLLRLLGRFEEALELERAQASTPSGLYDQALLSYELGEMDAAGKLLSGLVQEGSAPLEAETAARCHYLLALIHIETGRFAEAENSLRILAERYPGAAVAPAALLARRELELRRNNPAGAEEAAQELCRRFPGSPECALASSKTNGRVRLSPTPGRLLAGLEAQPVSAPAPQAGSPAPETVLQVGSFRDEENAGYLVSDLKAKGFKARIAEAVIRGVRYYRVVIGAAQGPEQTQTLLVRLKEAGFEGVLLLPD